MNREDLILPVSRIPQIAEFLAALEVKAGGFGAKLFTEIYEEVFTWSVDLRDQYNRYYCVEYPTLQQYLELAHEVNLTTEQLEERHILKIKSPGGLIDRAYDDNILDVVVECIKNLGTSDEGKD